MRSVTQLVLIILDGWGYREDMTNNAIALANPECMNTLWSKFPHTLFEASGEAIGLLPGNIGTSEIGHLTIGTGSIIDTDVVRVFKSIQDKSLNNNPTLQALFSHVKKNNSTLHLMGLLSPGSVHSHQEHLFAFITLAKKAGIKDILIHPFLDGRDTPPKSGIKYLKQLEKVVDNTGVGKIGTVSGRYFAMDRDTNWERTQLVVDALFLSKGDEQLNKRASTVLQEFYEKGTTDEFVKPYIITKKPISLNDGILFFNFRPDRARQISSKILEKVSDLNLYFASLTEYSKDLPTHILFPQIKIPTSLSQELSRSGLSQVHIAETEKYAHVTYFLNGGNENKHPREEFVLIHSRKDISTHDQAPEMKAKEIADTAIEYINKGTNFLAINFANADMVGHTGKLEPTIQAVKTIDTQIKRIIDALNNTKGVAFITADHGNAEEMVDETTGEAKTAHTLNRVPGILTLTTVKLRQNGTLADIAPTILSLFNLKKPASMTGTSLLEEAT